MEQPLLGSEGSRRVAVVVSVALLGALGVVGYAAGVIPLVGVVMAALASVLILAVAFGNASALRAVESQRERRRSADQVLRERGPTLGGWKLLGVVATTTLLLAAILINL